MGTLFSRKKGGPYGSRSSMHPPVREPKSEFVNSMSEILIKTLILITKLLINKKRPVRYVSGFGSGVPYIIWYS